MVDVDFKRCSKVVVLKCHLRMENARLKICSKRSVHSIRVPRLLHAQLRNPVKKNVNLFLFFKQQTNENPTKRGNWR